MFGERRRLALLKVTSRDPLIRAMDLDQVFAGMSFRYKRKPAADPEKEANTRKTLVESRLRALVTVLQEDGIDPEDHFAAMKQDQELAAKYGVQLPSPAQGGSPQTTAPEKPVAPPAKANVSPNGNGRGHALIGADHE